MAEMTIKLIKKWSDWEAGAVLTLETEKAKRVIAKGYAEPCTAAKARGRRAEAAMVVPTAERADARPTLPGQAFPASDDND